MARLPQPGQDGGTWGEILNEFLSVEHNQDGTLKAGGSLLNKYTKPPAGIPESDLSAGVIAKLNTSQSTAVQSVNGKTGVVLLSTDDLSDTTATNKFVSAADKTKLSNISGTNTGDQDLSQLVSKTTTVNGHALSGNVSVTKADLNLENVDNTSDAIKFSTTATLTNKTISGTANTFSQIPQSAITNLSTDLSSKLSNITGMVSAGSNVTINGSGTSASPYVVSVATPAATSWGTVAGTLSDQTDLQLALSAKANLASPTFTGIPSVPTASAGTSTAQIASTSFVSNAISTANAGITSVYLTQAAYDALATKLSSTEYNIIP